MVTQPTTMAPQKMGMGPPMAPMARIITVPPIIMGQLPMARIIMEPPMEPIIMGQPLTGPIIMGQPLTGPITGLPMGQTMPMATAR